MNKRQLIDSIRQINTGVRAEFLAQFDELALEQYLDHLTEARQKRVDMPSWIRRQPKLRLVG